MSARGSNEELEVDVPNDPLKRRRGARLLLLEDPPQPLLLPPYEPLNNKRGKKLSVICLK